MAMLFVQRVAGKQDVFVIRRGTWYNLIVAENDKSLFKGTII